jgi:hypothetical protein
MREPHQSYHSNERSSKNRIVRIEPQTYYHQQLQPLRGSLSIDNPPNQNPPNDPAIFSEFQFQHPPTRASCEKNCLVPHILTTDAFHLGVTTSAQKIKPNTILLWLNHLAQSCPQFRILVICDITLEHAILHPLTVRLQHLVNFRASLVFRNIVRNHHKHRNLFQNEWWIFIGF